MICQNKILKSENDTHEFVAYFEKEMETKDDVISKLNDELIRKEVRYITSFTTYAVQIAAAQYVRVFNTVSTVHTKIILDMRK